MTFVLIYRSPPIVAEQEQDMGTPFPGYQAGRYISGRSFNGASGTLAMIADELRAVPLIMDGADTWTSLSINVTATGTATLARLGIFNSANGLPTTLLLDAGTVSVGSTGIKSAAISQSLPAGWYFAVIVANGTVTITAQAAGTNQEHEFTESIGVAAIGVGDFSMVKAFAFAALSGASPYGAPTFGTAAFPTICLKK